MPADVPQDLQLLYTQSSFRGGLNQFVDPTKLTNTEYALLINGRVRNDVIEPNAQPVENNFGLPDGKIQGIYAEGGFILAFVAGIAYYRNAIVDDGNFIAVVGWTPMDANVDRIYVQSIPASSVNFKRSIADPDQVNTNVLLADIINSSPKCAVCQDGVNQPNLIFADGTSRVSQNYNDWTTDNREYVPIGTLMMYNGALWVLANDGTTLYRSVYGRPLDFVIAVDENGDKAADASTGAHTVGFANVTGLFPSNSGDGSFIVASTNGTTMCTPNGQVLFGQDLFRNVPLFPTGVSNQFCFVENNGDLLFIDNSGIRSFNAVLQLRTTGKNAPFSMAIANIIKGVSQYETNCAASFDDYCLFMVNTVYGPAIIVYDQLYEKFVSLDVPTFSVAGERIKQFAVVELVSTHKIFCITTANKLYQLYASTTLVENCQVYLGEWISNNLKIEQKAYMFRAVFNDVLETGTVFATLYNDRVAETEISANVINPIVTVVPPITPPFGDSPSIDSVKNLQFLFQDVSDSAWKLGVWLEWDFKAKLSHISMEASKLVMNVNLEQGSQVAASIMEGQPVVTSMTPSSGPVGTVVTLGGTGLQGITSASINGVVAGNVSSTPRACQFTIMAGSVTGRIKLVKPNSNTFTSQVFTVT